MMCVFAVMLFCCCCCVYFVCIPRIYLKKINSIDILTLLPISWLLGCCGFFLVCPGGSVPGGLIGIAPFERTKSVDFQLPMAKTTR